MSHTDNLDPTPRNNTILKMESPVKKDKIVSILKKPSDERSVAVFNPEFLKQKEAITKTEHERLQLLFPNKVKLKGHRAFNFLVSLSHASSMLEGNTYTEIDTRTLLEDNIPSAENTAEETKMLINHKNAFELIIKASQLERKLIESVHSELSNNDGVENSRHFLPAEFRGTVRTYDDVHIGQTTYIPPVDYPGRKPTIADYLDTIIETANTTENPLEKSIYLFTRLPYLQAFRDCNKRTSRLIGNLPLLLASAPPISFNGFAKPAYNRSIVAFYEFGNTELFKEGFISAYINSALHFHPFDPETSIELQLRNKSDLVEELTAFVINGENCAEADMIIASTGQTIDFGSNGPEI